MKRIPVLPLLCLIYSSGDLFAYTDNSLAHQVLTPPLFDQTIEQLITWALFIFTLLLSILLFAWNKRLQEEKQHTNAAMEQLEVVLNSSAVGIWKLDLVKGTSYNDARMFKILDFERDACAIPIDDLPNYVHPGDVDSFMGTLQKCIEGDMDKLRIEFRGRKRDGTYCWIHDAGKVTKRDKNGKATEIVGVAMDVTTLKDAQEAALRANDANERLLRELYHRVKNNLQVISSFLSLQANHYKDSVLSDLLNESNLRIRAMSLIHEQLSHANEPTRVSLQHYLENLISENLRLHSCCVPSWRLDTDKLELSIGSATLLGLIVNEILNNAFKHAFPTVEAPNIVFKFCNDAETATLRLSAKDNGDVSMGKRERPTLGMEIIEALTLQLEGDMHLNTERGYHYEFSFPQSSFQ